eukprot:5457986-Karenia_brevis.AAC.1
MFTKVKGHATKSDVINGLISGPDRKGNRQADALAVAGAALQAIPDDVVMKARSRKFLTMDIQRMMLQIAAVRAERLHHMRTDPASELSESSSTDSQQEDEQESEDDTSVIEISSDEDMLPPIFVISDTEEDD